MPDAGIARKNGLTDADFHGSIYPGSYNYAESRLTHTPVIHYGEGIDGGIASGQYDPKETVEGALADAEHETDYQGRYDKPTMRQLEQLYADDENNKGVIRVWNQTATPNTLLHEQAHAVMQPHLTGMNYQASPETRRDASNFFLNNLRGNGNTRPDPWQDPKLGMTEAMGYNVSNPKQLSQSGYQSLVQQSMDYLRSVGALDVLDKYGQIINQANFHDPGGKPYRQK